MDEDDFFYLLVALGPLLILFLMSLDATRTRRAVEERNAPDNGTQTNHAPRQRVPRRRGGVETCPICFSAPPDHEVETNCGHVFCGACAKSCWEHAGRSTALPCPLCRQSITIFFPNFPDTAGAEPGRIGCQHAPPFRLFSTAGFFHCMARCYGQKLFEEGNIDPKASGPDNTWAREALAFVGEYNRALSEEPRSIVTQIREIPTMVRHLWLDLWQGGVVDALLRLRILLVFVVVLAYLVAPLDLLPEAVYGVLGLLDDVLVFLFVLLHVISLYRHAVVQAH